MEIYSALYACAARAAFKRCTKVNGSCRSVNLSATGFLERLQRLAMVGAPASASSAA
jgi:hypothetical protein